MNKGIKIMAGVLVGTAAILYLTDQMLLNGDAADAPPSAAIATLASSGDAVWDTVGDTRIDVPLTLFSIRSPMRI